MINISYSVVLYNNTIEQIKKLYVNIIDTVPANMKYNIFFVNNSVNNNGINEEVKRLCESNTRVTLITPKINKGFGAGNNLAISRANSEYHIVLNPDIMIPDKNQIKKMIEFMKKSECVLLSPLIKYPNGRVQQLVKRTPTVFDMGIRFLGKRFFPKRQLWFTYSPDGYQKIHSGNNFPGSFLVFDTAILHRIHGFDEHYFLYMEDADISRQMALKGKAVFFPDAFVYHEWQRNNRKSIKGVFQMLKSMRTYFNKWGWKLF